MTDVMSPAAIGLRTEVAEPPRDRYVVVNCVVHKEAIGSTFSGSGRTGARHLTNPRIR
jgi:hypothetical protein